MTRTEATPERIAKLPTWARNHIARLVFDAEHRDATIDRYAKLLEQPGDDNTVVAELPGGLEDVALPAGTRITFLGEGPNEEMRVYADKRRRKGFELNIMTVHGALAVTPQCSNVIHVATCD